VTSVLGPTASEDRHAARPNKQSGGDQDDAQDQLALDQLHNADHDKDGGDDPQNGCIHDAIYTLARSDLSLVAGRLRSRRLLQVERFFGGRLKFARRLPVEVAPIPDLLQRFGRA
jgi:hypothetical protein